MSYSVTKLDIISHRDHLYLIYDRNSQILTAEHRLAWRHKLFVYLEQIVN